jgi:(1->4)-alpha-D-glucan 1-alpha-D-glucosylmutase
VEKILAENEPLPVEWKSAGTTGYEFIAQLAGIFVDARSERQFTSTYAAFSGEPSGFDDIVYENKRRVLDEMFANAVTRLGSQLADMLQADRRWRDLTRYELTVAIREIMAGHGVYRTYRRGVEKMGERDRRVVEQASAIASRRNSRLGAEPFELVRDVLLGVYPDEAASFELRESLSDWVMSFQQYTGAVMAKAVEDTAFYTYNRFIALNEVGGNPGHFGGATSAFHAANAERARVTPHALLATATHDTKLGEDVRARLYALSEIPHEWREALEEWRELNQRHKTMVDGRSAPDVNEEYRLYQVLLGAWPADDSDPSDEFRKRIREHVRKAVNEAGRNTSWIQPNEGWLEAGDRFIDRILGEDTGKEFLASFRPRARRLAHLGMVNSLVQAVLKSMSPGVPDFYQGSELWDLSLVDPDNRRTVDYERREEMARKSLESLEWSALLRDWRTGEIKLQLTRALLKLRRSHADVFQFGDYHPLEAAGRFAENIVAFVRSDEVATIVVLVPRVTSRLGCPPLGIVWDDTTVALPRVKGPWKDAITGRMINGRAKVDVAGLFVELPFAVLMSGGNAYTNALKSERAQAR